MDGISASVISAYNSVTTETVLSMNAGDRANRDGYQRYHAPYSVVLYVELVTKISE